jgi:hypothetical protein
MSNLVHSTGPIQDLSTAWDAVRGRKHRAKRSGSGIREAAVAPLLRWALSFAEPDRPTFLTISGATEEREALLRAYLHPKYNAVRPDTVEDVVGDQTRGWVERGAVDSFIERVAVMRVPVEVRQSYDLDAIRATEWELLWGLIVVDTLIVEEPLRDLVDRSSDIVSDVHRALWEARFLFREHPSVEPAATFLGTMARWLAGAELKSADIERLTAAGIRKRIERDTDKLDATCFILTLAAQNGIVNRVLLTFDGIENALRSDGRPALRQLLCVVRAVDRWVRMGGCPIGLFLGLTGTETNVARLRKMHLALARRVESGRSWCTQEG